MIGKAVGAALAALAVLLGVVALVAALIASLNPFNTGSDAAPGAGAAPDGTAGPSPSALADIPADYLALYQDAARVCPGLHWSILAGIGKVESDHGRSNAPGVHSGQNSAGAKGPMQFLQTTFNAVITRHPLPGRDGHSPPSPYDPTDAIPAAAFLLCDDGARDGRDIYNAIFSYNHDSNYVTRVLEIAHQYTAATPGAPGSPQPGIPPQAQPAPVDPSAAPRAQAVPEGTGAFVVPVRLTAGRLSRPRRIGVSGGSYFGIVAEVPMAAPAPRPVDRPTTHATAPRRPAPRRWPHNRPQPAPPATRVEAAASADRTGIRPRPASTARPARKGRADFRRTTSNTPTMVLSWPVVNDAAGLGRQILGPNPTEHERLLAADLDHLGMQVTRETVLGIRNVLLGAADRYYAALDAQAGRSIRVGPPGGDPISPLAANELNRKADALHDEYRKIADGFKRAGNNLTQIARNYGYTEQTIADSFRKYVKDNQDTWSRQLQQNQTVAGLPDPLRQFLDALPPTQPPPRSSADLFRDGLG